jgi:hypothetical protein
MRLIIQHQISSEESEFLEHIKKELIAKIAVDHLVNLLEYSQGKSRPYKDTISGDFCLLTNSQVKRLIDTLPIGYHSEVIGILKEEIPELNIPTT